MYGLKTYVLTNSSMPAWELRGTVDEVVTHVHSKAFDLTNECRLLLGNLIRNLKEGQSCSFGNWNVNREHQVMTIVGKTVAKVTPGFCKSCGDINIYFTDNTVLTLRCNGDESLEALVSDDTPLEVKCDEEA